MTNPYESPQTSPIPPEPGESFGRSVGMFLAGFFATMLLTMFASMFSMAIASVLVAVLPEPLEIVLIFLCSPVVIGPVCCISLWLLTRKRNRPFAVGSSAFGVAAFLLAGGCFLVLSSSGL